MSNKNAKKTTAKTSLNINRGDGKVIKMTLAGSPIEVGVAKPSLADLVSGKGEAVSKAVADRAAIIAPATAAKKVIAAVVSELKGDAKAMIDAAEVLTSAVKKHKPNVAPAKAVVKENKKAEKAAKKASPAKVAGAAETVASFMRRLIGEGKSNEEVFAAAQKVYAIGEEKKHYPSWYRCEMKRKASAEKTPVAKAPEKKAAKGKDLPKVTKVATKKKVTAKA